MTSPLGGIGSLAEDEFEGGMLLDPPDPLDLLIAHTENSTVQKPRALDFVRAKFQEVKKDNKKLRERVADLEQTLSIVQTAQEWSIGKGMTPEQKDKMREIKGLLEQAKKAREDIQNFSGASRQALYEQLRTTKAQLRREKQEKAEMKDRLLHAFDHARAIKEQHRQVSQQKAAEQERWENTVRDMKERHRRELRRLQGDGAVMEADRHDELSFFGEQVLDGLSSLQGHLQKLRQDTVDTVLVEEDEELPGETIRYGEGGAEDALSAGENDEF